MPNNRLSWSNNLNQSRLFNVQYKMPLATVFKIKITKPDQLNNLMTLSGYEEFLKKA